MYIKGSKHQSVKSFQLTITQTMEGNVSPELNLSLNRAKLLVTTTMDVHSPFQFLPFQYKLYKFIRSFCFVFSQIT